VEIIYLADVHFDYIRINFISLIIFVYINFFIYLFIILIMIIIIIIIIFYYYYHYYYCLRECSIGTTHIYTRCKEKHNCYIAVEVFSYMNQWKNCTYIIKFSNAHWDCTELKWVRKNKRSKPCDCQNNRTVSL
jgi:hypothetical protein